MKILSAVTNTLKFLFNEKNIKFTLIAALAICAMLLFKSCNDKRRLKQEAERQQLINAQNQRALTDSLHYMKNRVGEIEAIKSSFISKMEDLEKLNKDLYVELKKEIGTVKSLIKANADIDRGEVTMSNDLIKYPDGKTYGLTFKDVYADSALTWRLRGESKFKYENNTIFPGTTTIFENNMQVKLVMGFKENKDNYEVFARSGSPLVRFNDLDGVIIIPKKADLTCPPVPKKKRFGLGLSVGYGIGTRPNSPFVGFGPYVGLSLNYNLIELW